jgi:DNA-nicking Smr family endonuclease
MGKKSKRPSRQPAPPLRDSPPSSQEAAGTATMSDADRALFELTMQRGAQAPTRDESKERRRGESKERRDTSKERDEASTLASRPFGAALAGLKKQLAAQQAAIPKVAKPAPKPRSTRPEPKPYDPADEERAFAQAIAGVAMLPDDDSVPRGRTAKTRPPRLEDDEAEVMAELADLVAGIGDFDASFTDEHIEGIADGLDKRLLRKLKRGAFSYRSHLDLHGLTRAEARPRVEGFLAEARKRGERCVLIVHGRGLHSKEGIPVLKEAVNSWLLRGRISKAVLAFCSARSTDGGLGALYVLLRK